MARPGGSFFRAIARLLSAASAAGASRCRIVTGVKEAASHEAVPRRDDVVPDPVAANGLAEGEAADGDLAAEAAEMADGAESRTGPGANAQSGHQRAVAAPERATAAAWYPGGRVEMS